MEWIVFFLMGLMFIVLILKAVGSLTREALESLFPWLLPEPKPHTAPPSFNPDQFVEDDNAGVYASECPEINLPEREGFIKTFLKMLVEVPYEIACSFANIEFKGGGGYTSTHSPSEVLPNGYTRQDYYDVGLDDFAIQDLGMDQPGAPSPDVFPPEELWWI